ncbi:Ssn2p SCDLUD_003338 [Saccharomycodes ludwigii]|uniref:Ssn2p n=1 Tax=Saccharomycodes ludwigii TaxID=36035 RepID=UPI001E837557|nr:hypothetical protein SCDLUD_003338 [Saccharomycodes ludwigii]KAH3900364.1 hypothetical protein SCDLUD_003338 [Saccharomycodes ludwigii]
MTPLLKYENDDLDYRLDELLSNYFCVKKIIKVNYEQYLPKSKNQDDQWSFQAELSIRKKNSKSLVALFSKELWCFSINDDPVPKPYASDMKTNDNNTTTNATDENQSLVDPTDKNLENKDMSLSNQEQINIKHTSVSPTVLPLSLSNEQFRNPDKVGEFNSHFSKPNLPTPYAIFLKALRKTIHLNICKISKNSFIPFGNSCIYQPTENHTTGADQLVSFDSHIFDDGHLNISVSFKKLNFNKLIQSPEILNDNEYLLNNRSILYIAPSGVKVTLPFSDIKECITTEPPMNEKVILETLLYTHGIDLTGKENLKWIKVIPSLTHLAGQTSSISSYSLTTLRKIKRTISTSTKSHSPSLSPSTNNGFNQTLLNVSSTNTHNNIGRISANSGVDTAAKKGNKYDVNIAASSNVNINNVNEEFGTNNNNNNISPTNENVTLGSGLKNNLLKKIIIWPLDLIFVQTPTDSPASKDNNLEDMAFGSQFFTVQDAFCLLDELTQLKLTSTYRIPGITSSKGSAAAMSSGTYYTDQFLFPPSASSINSTNIAGTNPYLSGGYNTRSLGSPHVTSLSNTIKKSPASNYGVSTKNSPFKPRTPILGAQDKFLKDAITEDDINNTSSDTTNVEYVHKGGSGIQNLKEGVKSQAEDAKQEGENNYIDGTKDHVEDKRQELEDDNDDDTDMKDLFGDDEDEEESTGDNIVNYNEKIIEVPTDIINEPNITPLGEKWQHNSDAETLPPNSNFLPIIPKKRYLDIPVDEMIAAASPNLYSDPGAPLPIETPKERRQSIFAPLKFNPKIESGVDNKYKNGGKFFVSNDISTSSPVLHKLLDIDINNYDLLSSSDEDYDEKEGSKNDNYTTINKHTNGEMVAEDNYPFNIKNNHEIPLINADYYYTDGKDINGNNMKNNSGNNINIPLNNLKIGNSVNLANANSINAATGITTTTTTTTTTNNNNNNNNNNNLNTITTNNINTADDNNINNDSNVNNNNNKNAAAVLTNNSNQPTSSVISNTVINDPSYINVPPIPAAFVNENNNEQGSASEPFDVLEVTKGSNSIGVTSNLTSSMGNNLQNAANEHLMTTPLLTEGSGSPEMGWKLNNDSLLANNQLQTNSISPEKNNSSKEIIDNKNCVSLSSNNNHTNIGNRERVSVLSPQQRNKNEDANVVQLRNSNVLQYVLRTMPIFSIPDYFLFANPTVPHSKNFNLFLETLTTEIVFNNILNEVCFENTILYETFDSISPTSEVLKVFSELFGSSYRLQGNELIDDLYSIEQPDILLKKSQNDSKIPTPILKIKSDVIDFVDDLRMKPLNLPKNFSGLFLTSMYNQECLDFMTMLMSQYNDMEFGHCDLVQLTNEDDPGVIYLKNFNSITLLLLAAQIVTYCFTQKKHDASQNSPLVIFLPVSTSVGGNRSRTYDALNSVVEMCHNFTLLKTEVLNRLPTCEILLRLISIDNFIGDPLKNIRDSSRLCLSIYNILPSSSSKYTHLAKQIPETIKFDLPSGSSAHSLNSPLNHHYDTYVHVAYSRSIDKEWLCTAWSSVSGADSKVKTWYIGNSKPKFESACNEIWTTTLKFIMMHSSSLRTCVVLSRLDSILPDDELMHWRRLSSKTKQIHLAVVCCGTNTKLTFCDGDKFHPEYKRPLKHFEISRNIVTKKLPIDASAKFVDGGDIGNENNEEKDDDYLIVNAKNYIYSVVFKSALPLSNSQHRCAIKSGALIRFNGGDDDTNNNNNIVDKFEVNLLNCPHSDSKKLLKVILKHFHDLSALTPWYCVYDNFSFVPWHILAVEKMIKNVIHLKVEETKH